MKYSLQKYAACRKLGTLRRWGVFFHWASLWAGSSICPGGEKSRQWMGGKAHLMKNNIMTQGTASHDILPLTVNALRKSNEPIPANIKQPLVIVIKIQPFLFRPVQKRINFVSYTWKILKRQITLFLTLNSCRCYIFMIQIYHIHYIYIFIYKLCSVFSVGKFWVFSILPVFQVTLFFPPALSNICPPQGNGKNTFSLTWENVILVST